MILVSLLVVDVSDLVSGFGSVSYFNLAPSSRLRHLSIRSSFVDVSGLVTGLVFEPGSELPFAMPAEKIKLRRCFWFRF